MSGRRGSSSSRSYGFPPEAFDPSTVPEIAKDYPDPEGLLAFAKALDAPNRSPSNGITSPSSTSFARSPRLSEAGDSVSDLLSADGRAASIPDIRQSISLTQQQPSIFISAQNDWAPVNKKVRKPSRSADSHQGRHGKKASASPTRALLGERTKDETREGILYTLFKWPLFLTVASVVIFEWVCYLFTRVYIWLYEQMFAELGVGAGLRRQMRAADTYDEWVTSAKELDEYLGRELWKRQNKYAYYDASVVDRVRNGMNHYRNKAERLEGKEGKNVKELRLRLMGEIKGLAETSVRNNFLGVEGPRLYSQTYYGTKHLVQRYVDEVGSTVDFLRRTGQLPPDEKRKLFKRLYANYGRTALCLSGGATFAYYHFGVVKALLDADLLPDVITGTSGGALVAALVATRTNDELKELLVPALATRITACHESIWTWLARWWRTRARFDAVDWAKRSMWWTRGSMTFREAYERTGRILNVSCVPSDPHSPTILCNYLTSPDCVIWSAVLASAAVPGILPPVVLMMKNPDGSLVPYSFGRRWKDGSLRTDIPIKALNLHFNVNFTIVSQVNPHINLFFFSSRGTVGHPVLHRKGAGWRGGYLMSAFENFLKLDMTKWLRFVRHAELFPRIMGQDWSQLWLQDAFTGTITIWPMSFRFSDFVKILSDPSMDRLARMIHEGQQGTFPKLNFVQNRLRIERSVIKGRNETKPWARRGSIETIISEDDIQGLRLEGEESETGTDGTEAIEGPEDGLGIAGDVGLADVPAVDAIKTE